MKKKTKTRKPSKPKKRTAKEKRGRKKRASQARALRHRAPQGKGKRRLSLCGAAEKIPMDPSGKEKGSMGPMHIPTPKSPSMLEFLSRWLEPGEAVILRSCPKALDFIEDYLTRLPRPVIELRPNWEIENLEAFGLRPPLIILGAQLSQRFYDIWAKPRCGRETEGQLPEPFRCTVPQLLAQLPKTLQHIVSWQFREPELAKEFGGLLLPLLPDPEEDDTRAQERRLERIFFRLEARGCADELAKACRPASLAPPGVLAEVGPEGRTLIGWAAFCLVFTKAWAQASMTLRRHLFRRAELKRTDERIAARLPDWESPNLEELAGRGIATAVEACLLAHRASHGGRAPSRLDVSALIARTYQLYLRVRLAVLEETARRMIDSGSLPCETTLFPELRASACPKAAEIAALLPELPGREDAERLGDSLVWTSIAYARRWSRRTEEILRESLTRMEGRPCYCVLRNLCATGRLEWASAFLQRKASLMLSPASVSVALGSEDLREHMGSIARFSRDARMLHYSVTLLGERSAHSATCNLLVGCSINTERSMADWLARRTMKIKDSKLSMPEPDAKEEATRLERKAFPRRSRLRLRDLRRLLHLCCDAAVGQGVDESRTFMLHEWTQVHTYAQYFLSENGYRKRPWRSRIS